MTLPSIASKSYYRQHPAASIPLLQPYRQRQGADSADDQPDRDRITDEEARSVIGVVCD